MPGSKRPRRALLVVLGLVVGALARPAGAELTLVDVAAEAGVDFVSVSGDGSMDWVIEANGNGAAVFDYDRDGDPDLLLVSGSTLELVGTPEAGPLLALYRNEGDWRFREVTPDAGLEATGWGMGACVGDVDGDAWPDVYVTAWGANRLYRNRGDGSFEEIAAAAGVADPRWSHSCAFSDLDADGDQDLYVANYLVFDTGTIPPRGPGNPCGYRGNRAFCGPQGLVAEPDALYLNRGDGTFDEAAGAVAEAPPRYSLGVLAADLGGDRRPELFVSNDSQDNHLFRQGEEGLEEAGLLTGLALSDTGQPQASMGIAWGDDDADGDLDLFVTNFSEDYNTLYRNHGGGLFSDVTAPAGLRQVSLSRLGWGTLMLDLDLDGRLDLYVANGHVFEDVETFGLGSTYFQPDQVLLGDVDGRFRQADVIRGAPAGGGSSRGLATGDFDGDGDPDLVVVHVNDRPSLLRNDLSRNGGSATRRLAVSFADVGPCGPYGARLTLSGGGAGVAWTQLRELAGGGSYLSESQKVGLFGLAGGSPEALEVRCPRAGSRRYLAPPLGVRLVLDPRAPGSVAGP